MGKWDIDDNDIDTQISIRDMDEYDQYLMDLKQMVNERNKFPPKYQPPHNIVIENAINALILTGHAEGIPKEIVNRDIDIALKGGKYRRIIPEPKTSNNIIQLRAKKSRKPVKRKTCYCKKK